MCVSGEGEGEVEKDGTMAGATGPMGGKPEVELEDDEEVGRERREMVLSEAGLRSQGQAEGHVDADLWLRSH